MNIFSDNQSSKFSSDEEKGNDEALDNLLKQGSSNPEVSAFFTQKVMHALEKESHPASIFWYLRVPFIQRIAVAILIACTALISAFVFHKAHQSSTMLAEADHEIDAVAVFDDLNDLIVYQDSVFWVDSF